MAYVYPKEEKNTVSDSKNADIHLTDRKNIKDSSISSSSAESVVSLCTSSSSNFNTFRMLSQSTPTLFPMGNSMPITDTEEKVWEKPAKTKAMRISTLSSSCFCCPFWDEEKTSLMKEEVEQPIPSRNRSKQRWEANPEGRIRLCCTAIPFRFTVCPTDGSKSIEVLLITSRRKGDWIIPRGGWDHDETKSQCAVRETREEAGVEGNIIASFGHYKRLSTKGYDTKVYIFIMNVSVVKERWAEQCRERKWFDLETIINNIDTIFQRPEIADIWKRLISFSKTESSQRTVKGNIYDMLGQIQQLFDIRKTPIAMLPWKAGNPVLWHDHARIATWLDNHFPIATTVRGQPGLSRKNTIQYKRPWSYFVVQRDGRTTQCLGRMRSVERPRFVLLEHLKNHAMNSRRRTFMETAFKFLWVLTISGEFLVTEEYTRRNEDRFTNHGDLVPARLTAFEYYRSNLRRDSNIVQNVDLQGKYRGIARMGGELIYAVKSGTWIMNNISGFSLARVTPRCISLPSKKTLQESDAHLGNLEYDSLAKLRVYLSKFIFNMHKVILLSADIAGMDLKQGLRLMSATKNKKNEQMKSYKIRMEDLLDIYLKIFI